MLKGDALICFVNTAYPLLLPAEPSSFRMFDLYLTFHCLCNKFALPTSSWGYSKEQDERNARLQGGYGAMGGTSTEAISRWNNKLCDEANPGCLWGLKKEQLIQSWALEKALQSRMSELFPEK